MNTVHSVTATPINLPIVMFRRPKAVWIRDQDIEDPETLQVKTTFAVAKDESRVLSKAVCRAAEHMGVANNALARVLGLSQASVSRLKNGQYLLPPETKAFELAAHFVRLFRGLDAIMGGDDEAARAWLYAENTALRGRPIDLIQSVAGLVNVVAYVDSRRARV